MRIAKRAVLGLALMGAMMAVTASSAVARNGKLRGPIAHAAQIAACTPWALADDPWVSEGWDGEFGTVAYIETQHCVWAENGSEIGGAYYTPTKPPEKVTLLGCVHAELTDNGTAMINGGQVCPLSFNSTTPLYSGWINHPYWGTYCSIIWIEYPTEGKYTRVGEHCLYTNGYTT